MKKKELKKLSDEEKLKQLNELRLELAKERAHVAVGGAPSKTGKIRALRKTIARLLTYLKSDNISSDNISERGVKST